MREIDKKKEKNREWENTNQEKRGGKGKEKKYWKTREIKEEGLKEREDSEKRRHRETFKEVQTSQRERALKERERARKRDHRRKNKKDEREGERGRN